jgi:rare lipoprotein A
MLLLFVAVLTLIGCSGQAARPTPGEFEQVGLASYYANMHHGRKTASGERYDRNAFTAAHNDLPFGAIVEVTHLVNGRTVRVRINDRGPFVKGRIIDLSYAAAKEIKIIGVGVAKVRLTLIDGP